MTLAFGPLSRIRRTPFLLSAALTLGACAPSVIPAASPRPAPAPTPAESLWLDGLAPALPAAVVSEAEPEGDGKWTKLTFAPAPGGTVMREATHFRGIMTPIATGIPQPAEFATAHNQATYFGWPADGLARLDGRILFEYPPSPTARAHDAPFADILSTAATIRDTNVPDFLRFISPWDTTVFASQTSSAKHPDAPVLLLLPGLAGHRYSKNLLAHAARLGMPIAVCSNSNFQLVSTEDLFLDDTALLDRVEILSAQNLHGYVTGVRAAYDALDDGSPLVGRDIVILGLSFGAIHAPTVAAALGPERVRAMILVGGGADMLRISATSAYFPPTTQHGARTVLLRRRLGPAALNAQLERRIPARPFDPANTAPALTGIPTLIVQAANDRIVPRASGDLLWERLGRPERWVVPGGHTLLFLRLPALSDRIAAWLENHVSPPSLPSEASVTLPAAAD